MERLRFSEQTEKVQNAIRKHNIEFNAMLYLRKPKFDNMTKSQKDKAVKLLSEFEQFLNEK